MADNKAAGTAATLRDVDVYMGDITRVVQGFQKIVERLQNDEASNLKRRADRLTPQQRQELLAQRDQLKTTFIAKKQAARALIALLPKEASTTGTSTSTSWRRSTGSRPPEPDQLKLSAVALMKEAEVKQLQEQFRRADADFKQLKIAADRHALIGDSSCRVTSPSGASVASHTAASFTGKAASHPHSATSTATTASLLSAGRGTPIADAEGVELTTTGTTSSSGTFRSQKDELMDRRRGTSPYQERARGRNNGPTNDELLDSAKATQERTTAKLKEGLQIVVDTTDVGRHTAAKLEGDREKIDRTSRSLDEIQGELAMSAKLMTRFMKRIFTDKVIIAFTCLLVCGLVGIIVFATVKKDQQIFNVPDAVKPPIPGTTRRLL